MQNPDNIAKAQAAIEYYPSIFQKNPQDEEAYKAIAYLYGAIKEEDKLRQWIASRAASESTEATKRAEAYVVLASKDWDCSFKITEQPGVKITTVNEESSSATVSYQKPKDPKDFTTAQNCVKQGLAEAENAIKFDPLNELAWSYRPTCCWKLRNSLRWIIRRSRRNNLRKTTKPL